ncbi:MAG: topoisomerase, partial [Pseudonocardiales bacterium]|nr:topoisomerase [Pseudonocardiales bacterium]
LGNTPTVARASYVDGRIIDLYSDGRTIARALTRIDRLPDGDPRRQASLERAVLRLLSE